MIRLGISVPGKLYTDAITKALEETGNFRVCPLEEVCPYVFGEKSEAGEDNSIRSTMAWKESEPEVVLLGVSVRQGYTLKERRDVIERLRERQPNCRIVLFLDELVSPEQTTGVKNLKQAKLIDGFLYASGTMDYLVATLESV